MTDHFADGKARNLVEKLVNKGRPRDYNRHIGGVNHLRKTFLFSAFQRFSVSAFPCVYPEPVLAKGLHFAY
jgi:hypothetical protein